MKKRFIICLNNSTDIQEKKLIDYLNANSSGWWHWVKNTWLVLDNKGILKASILRDAVKDIFVGENMIVLEIDNNNDTWAGVGPNTVDKNMFDWIRKFWKKDI